MDFEKLDRGPFSCSVNDSESINTFDAVNRNRCFNWHTEWGQYHSFVRTLVMRPKYVDVVPGFDAPCDGQWSFIPLLHLVAASLSLLV